MVKYTAASLAPGYVFFFTSFCLLFVCWLVGLLLGLFLGLFISLFVGLLFGVVVSLFCFAKHFGKKISFHLLSMYVF